MSLKRHFALLLILTCAVPGAAEPFTVLKNLAPADLKLEGDLNIFGENGVPVHWVVTTSAGTDGQSRAALTLSGKGVELEAGGTIDFAQDTASWQLERSEVSGAEWFEAAVRRYAPRAAGSRFSGAVRLAGAGVFKPSEQVISGEMTVEIFNGEIINDEENWNVRQIAGQLALRLTPAISSNPGQRFTFAEGRVGEITVSNGVAEIELVNASRLRVQSLRLEAFGGPVSAEPFEVDFDATRISAALRVEGIELSELKNYLPESVADLKGKVSGRIRLLWSETGGMQFGKGELALDKAQGATVRLASNPGMFSSKVPRTFDLVGIGPEFLRRWFRKPNPAYPALQRIEEGVETLTIEMLNAQLEDPDSEGVSSIRVTLRARPTEPETAAAVKRLNLNLDMTVPLADMLKVGTAGSLSFQ